MQAKILEDLFRDSDGYKYITSNQRMAIFRENYCLRNNSKIYIELIFKVNKNNIVEADDFIKQQNDVINDIHIEEYLFLLKQILAYTVLFQNFPPIGMVIGATEIVGIRMVEVNTYTFYLKPNRR